MEMISKSLSWLSLLGACILMISHSVESKEVCYKPFGCFNKTLLVPYYPDPPEKIGAKFRVYTSDDPKGSRFISYHDDLNYQLFNETTSVGFLIHGWLDDGQNEVYRKLYKPMLKYFNIVISVNWSAGASGPLYPKNVANTQLTARETAYLLQILHEKTGLNMKTVNLIGFSLGAHIAGMAGRWLKQEYGLYLGQVTALDAAFPLIDGTEIHVRKSDALYVDSIHTSAGSGLDIIIGHLGTKKPFADKDFYPNGGTNQPFCPFAWLDMRCQHYAALEFFRSSMTSCQFVSTKCDSWKDFKNGECSTSNVKARMGIDSVEDKGEGSFFIETTKEWPFC